MKKILLINIGLIFLITNIFTYNDTQSYNHINKYKPKPKEFKDNEIYPYLEAHSFFTSIKDISNNFVQNYKNNKYYLNLPFEFNSFKDFIDYFKNLNF